MKQQAFVVGISDSLYLTILCERFVVAHFLTVSEFAEQHQSSQ